MGISGILMFFHLNVGLSKLVHEWAGWVMVTAVAAHVILNWRAFGIYFNRPLGKGIMATCAVVLAVSLVPVSGGGGGGGGSPVRPVMMAIGQTDVDTVIALSGLPLEEGLERLKTAGIPAEQGMAMPALTSGNREIQTQIIQTLFEN